MDPPLIEEYKVGPLPDVTSHSKIDSPAWKGNIPYRLRDFVAFIDFIALDEILKRELATAHDLLLQVTGHSYVSCTTNCLTFHAGYPGYTPSARKIIIVLTRQREGSFIHPIGLEVRVDTSNLDWRQWTVDQVWFRGQYFANIEDFVQRFDRSPFQNDFKPREYDPLDRNLFSALHFRGDPLPDEPPRRGPTCYMPDGRRFSVDRHRVTWQGWQFDVNMRTEISLQLHDIRFKGERVVYELGLSEIGVVYSGASFAGMRSAFLDGGFALGPHTQELFPEIDCPTDAIYFDFAHFWGWGPVTFRRSACVFELNQGVPLRRFFVSNSQGGYHYVQGMTSNVLVLRGIITLGNYDYIMDYIFHQTGAVEVKATLNGYVFGTFFTQEQGNRFGFEIAPDTMGIIHNHLIQYKVDVDVLGTENRFETLNITMEPVADVVDNLVDYQLQVFQRSLKRTEMEAAIRYNFDNPKYYLMGNANYNNSYGNQRSYRILPVNMGKNILPEGWKIEKGFAWARYQVDHGWVHRSISRNPALTLPHVYC